MSRKNDPASVTEKRTFPTRLKALMTEQNVTQKQLAAVVDMRPQTVSLYIQGQSTPDINCLKKIAEYFSVSADWLLGLTDIRTKDIDIRAMSEFTQLSEESIFRLHELSDMKYISRFISSLISQRSIKELDKNIKWAITAGVNFKNLPYEVTGAIPIDEIPHMSDEEYKKFREHASEMIHMGENAIEDSLVDGGFIKITLDVASDLFEDRAGGYLHGAVCAFISDVVNSVN